MKSFNTRILLIRTWLLILVPTLSLVQFCAGQGVATRERQTEVEIKILSAELTRFEKPIKIGTGERAIEYQEALVLKGEVNGAAFDALPPSIEPFLYIGRHEYRMFHIDRKEKRKELILTFHIRNLQELADNAPVVLTIDHGAPLRNPKKFEGRDDLPRFSKKMIVDKRPK